MNVIVTGGTGFLGRAVVELLKRKGYESVTSISRREGVDIRDYGLLIRKLKETKPELVIHCAAHVGGIAYNALHPVEVFEDNVGIGLNIVKACNELGIAKFINIMPNCVYPGHLEEYEETKFWDGSIHESVLTYGLPRKMMWGACFAYKQKNENFLPVHLVFPNMYGPHDHFEIVRSHALGALIRKIVDAEIKGEGTVEIWGTGKPVREWLYVEDGAEAIFKSMKNFAKFEANEILNVGIQKGISIKELATLIKKIVGWDGEFKYVLEKPDGTPKKILVAKRMKKRLNGWEPSTQLRQGIEKTVTWYKEHRSEILKKKQ